MAAIHSTLPYEPNKPYTLRNLYGLRKYRHPKTLIIQALIPSKTSHMQSEIVQVELACDSMHVIARVGP